MDQETNNNGNVQNQSVQTNINPIPEQNLDSVNMNMNQGVPETTEENIEVLNPQPLTTESASEMQTQPINSTIMESDLTQSISPVNMAMNQVTSVDEEGNNGTINPQTMSTGNTSGIQEQSINNSTITENIPTQSINSTNMATTMNPVVETMPEKNTEVLNPQTDVTENALGTQATSGPIIETIPENNIAENTEKITQDTAQNLTNSQPINNITQDQNLIEDNFNAVPKPPIFETEQPKKKKGNNKVLFILLIVVLIAGVGFGIYYFLVAAKAKAPINGISVKELKVELGEELSNNIDDYATITGFNKNDCTLDTKNISSTKVGAYKFTVTCANKNVEGTIIVDDTTNPMVITNEVVVMPSATVKAEDFIESCVDASSCTYKFKDEEVVQTSLQSIGEYNIEIIASDEYNNETTTNAKLIVTNNAPVKYLTCTPKPKEENDTAIDSYRFGIDKNNKLYNAVKTSELKYDDPNTYNEAKLEYKDIADVNNTVGKINYDDNNQTISIKTNTSLEEINKELNITLANDINTIQMYFTMLGYTCK